MESGLSAEVYFAQKLASNEKKIRDRAIKRLNRYLSVRSRHQSLNEPDLLKIWKGLFYCMWMQDKPLIQEELSQRITNLVQCFPKIEDALTFVKVFFETQSREWNGIDRLRLDKYMMMIRDMIHQTFTLLSKDDWQESHCRTFALSVYEHVMSAHESHLPDGLKLHLADIFVEELKKVSVEKLTSRTILILLQPFIEFILFTNKRELATRVMSEVIYKVIKAISTSRKVTKENADAADEANQRDEDMEVDVSSHGKVENQRCFQLDKGLLLKLMFAMAGRKEVRASNRAIIYRLMKRHSKFLANFAIGSAQTSDVEETFVCDLRFLKDDGKAVDQQQLEQRKKRRKKKNKEKHTECNSTTEDIVPVETVTAQNKDKPKAKKKKGKSGNDENASSGTQISPHVINTGNQNLRLVKNKSRLVNMKDAEKVVNSTTDHLDLQTAVLGDIKGLGNKPNSKNEQHISGMRISQEVCNNTAEVMSRKRKYVCDEGEDLPSRKKKLKRNSLEHTKESVKIPQHLKRDVENCQKKISSEAGEFVNKSGEERTFNVDTVTLFAEKDTNSNAKPKYRSISPPKSISVESTVELVKYTQKSPQCSFADQDVSRANASSPSPRVSKQPLSDVVTGQSSHSHNTGEVATVWCTEVLLQNPNIKTSTPRIKKSSTGGKLRSRSESPKKQKHIKMESTVATFSGTVGDLVVKDPLSIRLDDKRTASAGFKKKVIFDLRRNRANKFQDYLKSIAKQPDPPYEPTKSPAVGILKSPLNSPALSPSSSEVFGSDSEYTLQYTSKKGISYGRRASAPGSLVHSPGKRKKRNLFKTTQQSQSPSSSDSKGSNKHKV